MKVTVCELCNDPAGLNQDWPALTEHVAAEKNDLVLLPEMTFHPWLAGTNHVKPEQPFLTVGIDLAVARNAKHTYPRYVKE